MQKYTLLRLLLLFLLALPNNLLATTTTLSTELKKLDKIDESPEENDYILPVYDIHNEENNIASDNQNEQPVKTNYVSFFKKIKKGLADDFLIEYTLDGKSKIFNAKHLNEKEGKFEILCKKDNDNNDNKHQKSPKRRPRKYIFDSEPATELKIKITNQEESYELWLPYNKAENRLIFEKIKDPSQNKGNLWSIRYQMDKVPISLTKLFKKFQKESLNNKDKLPFPLYTVRIDNKVYGPSLYDLWERCFDKKKGKIELHSPFIKRSIDDKSTEGEAEFPKITFIDKSTLPNNIHRLQVTVSSSLLPSQGIDLLLRVAYKYSQFDRIHWQNKIYPFIELDSESRVLIGLNIIHYKRHKKQNRRSTKIRFDIPYILHYFATSSTPIHTNKRRIDIKEKSNFWVNIHNIRYIMSYGLIEQYVTTLRNGNEEEDKIYTILYEENPDQPLVKLAPPVIEEKIPTIEENNINNVLLPKKVIPLPANSIQLKEQPIQPSSATEAVKKKMHSKELSIKKTPLQQKNNESIKQEPGGTPDNIKNNLKVIPEEQPISSEEIDNNNNATVEENLNEKVKSINENKENETEEQNSPSFGDVQASSVIYTDNFSANYENSYLPPIKEDGTLSDTGHLPILKSKNRSRNTIVQHNDSEEDNENHNEPSLTGNQVDDVPGSQTIVIPENDSPVQFQPRVSLTYTPIKNHSPNQLYTDPETNFGDQEGNSDDSNNDSSSDNEESQPFSFEDPNEVGEGKVNNIPQSLGKKSQPQQNTNSILNNENNKVNNEEINALDNKNNRNNYLSITTRKVVKGVSISTVCISGIGVIIYVIQPNPGSTSEES